jgi:benzoyl-CoA reductase subunit B
MAAEPPKSATKTDYQGKMHALQKDMIGRYYDRLTAAAEGKGGLAVYMMISGNPVELIEAFDMIPVYPEVNALQLAVKKQSLPLILAAEEMGYSTDNCAYVKADVGMYFAGRKTPFATIPEPDLILCNYVGCNVYLQWFEHLAQYSGRPIYNLDVPFNRGTSDEPTEEDLRYVVKQLEEVIEILERMTGKKLDYKKLQHIMELSGETGELWSEIKKMTRLRPAPYDAYFDSVTMMAPLYCLRGTEDGVKFFREAYQDLKQRVDRHEGPLPEEKFRFVIEGPPPWPYLRAFRDMFSRWGAVAVASTYSTVGGIWEFGFRHDPLRPIESIARHMLQWNLTNRNFLQRYRQIKDYVEQWDADALVIHSIKSCRLFSAGQGDMREYFAKQLNVPTLLIESDLEDPRYFSEAQLRNRVDAFFESLEHQKLLVKK